MIAALFVATGGAYFDLPNVDPWDATRDARTYSGSDPVVAHPPCTRWCQLAYVVQARYGYKVGDDGGCFASALASVRRCGGVLEHPARSYAWAHHELRKPLRGRWARSCSYDMDSWVCEVAQSAYGHRARKLTWLLYVGRKPPPDLDWSVPEPTAQVSFMKNHGNSPLPRLSKREASASPPAFRDLLLSLAASAVAS